jgi:antitoxin component of RelBE/YafQ-DinJ toxin-antitoxin module
MVMAMTTVTFTVDEELNNRANDYFLLRGIDANTAFDYLCRLTAEDIRLLRSFIRRK